MSGNIGFTTNAMGGTTKPTMKFPVIFLIGMPGAGKTHWGRIVAKEYDWQFTDLDKYISEQEKASIPALFASYGENGFRERESKCLARLISGIKEPMIVACGGGTPCFAGNMQLMQEAGIVVYLESGIGTLLQNLEQSEEVRPLLKGRGDMAEYLKKMLKQREKYYQQANYILDTKFISLITFEEIVSKCINQL